MELVDSKAEIVLPNNTGNILENIYADIARAGRICYASNKTDKNYELVQDFIKKGHGRPLEFGTVYLITRDDLVYARYKENPYSKVNISITEGNSNVYFITTNYRVLVDNEWLDDLRYISAPVRGTHYERVTIHWTISRVTADSFRTHTTISSLMQSTRYCNYSKEKFGGELKICKPYWIDAPLGIYNFEYMISQDFATLTAHAREYVRHMVDSECRYNLFTETMNFPAEAARSILPLDVKTEFIQCAFIDSWDNFFAERAHDSTGKAQPDASKITREIEPDYLRYINGKI